MDIHNEFIGVQYNLVFYAGKPVLNLVHEFFDCDNVAWDFTGTTAATFKVWEERDGGLLLISWNLGVSGNKVILNASASDTDILIGKYYYEMESITGGYPVLLMYGEAKFI